MRWNSASTTPPPSSLFLESESHSVMSDSLRPQGLYSPWNSPGQNTGVGSLCLLQGIFPTQGSNPGLLHCRWIFYQLSPKGSPCSLKALVIPGRDSLESVYPCCRVMTRSRGVGGAPFAITALSALHTTFLSNQAPFLVLRGGCPHPYLHLWLKTSSFQVVPAGAPTPPRCHHFSEQIEQEAQLQDERSSISGRA